MTAAGYAVRESDPFVPGHEFGMLAPAAAPIVNRIQFAKAKADTR